MEEYRWELVHTKGMRDMGESPKFSGLICYDTRTFRSLAKTRLVEGKDAVIEIGCSYAKATKIISKAVSAENVVGIDVSKEAILQNRKKYPNVRFEQIDVLKCSIVVEELVKDFMVKPERANKSLVVFVDIGGNREIETLIKLLPWVASSLPVTPRLIIVKSETLYKEIKSGATGEDGGFDWVHLLDKAKSLINHRRNNPEETVNGESNAKKRKWKLHPRKAPMRKTKQSKIICRFHNYSSEGCKLHLDLKKLGTTCEFDHDHCHWCGKFGHVALNCKDYKPLV